MGLEVPTAPRCELRRFKAFLAGKNTRTRSTGHNLRRSLRAKRLSKAWRLLGFKKKPPGATWIDPAFRNRKEKFLAADFSSHLSVLFCCTPTDVVTAPYFQPNRCVRIMEKMRVPLGWYLNKQNHIHLIRSHWQLKHLGPQPKGTSFSVRQIRCAPRSLCAAPLVVRTSLFRKLP